MALLTPEVVLVAAVVLMVVGGFVLLFVMFVAYKYLDKKVGKRLEEFGGEGGVSKAIEQVNKARANDARELKERLSILEAKVEVLGQPNSDEKKLEMEKVFAKKK